MAVLRHNAAGGIVISASHNPAQWNALKLLNEKSEFLDADQGAAVMKIAQESGPNYVSYDKIGQVSKDDSISRYHIEEILKLPYINPEVIKAAGFNVALDAVNGAGSVIIPDLLRALGVKTINTIYCEPNGLFPHNPEPLPEHLNDICELVKTTRSDLGFVTDPDGDRLAMIDENGRFIGEEYTIAATIDFHLEKQKTPVVVNLSSSRISEDIATKHGVPSYRSAVGEINVVKKMQEVGSRSGGEGNGGVINPDLHPGRDALVGIAMTLQLLADRKISLGSYKDSLPEYHIIKSKVELGSVNADEVLANVTRIFADQRINTTDGVKIDFEDGWVHLRKSNTEPIIRVYAEAGSPKRAVEIAKPVMDQLK
jgi:phosphomannomutase